MIQGNIRLPEDICVPSTGEGDDLEKLIDHVFPRLDDNMSDPNYMTSRATSPPRMTTSTR